MIELEHSPLGGSGAHRFINCAFSFLKQRENIRDGTFEDVPSEFAALGTGAHELGAVCLATDAEPFEFLGQEFNGYKAGWPDEINLDGVQIYVNECRSIMERCENDGVAIVEKTYHLASIHPLLKGTVDFGYISQRHGLFLRDYKNGEGVGVAALDNGQLLYYGLLLILVCRGEGLDIPDSMPVSLGIVQPNFYGIFEDADVWEVDVAFVLNWGRKILLPRMNALYDDLRETPTDDDAHSGEWCQFCPVMLECPKMQKAFVEYANATEDFIAMLTNEELDGFYSQLENARRFMNALKETVKARKLTGADIPSAKLVEPLTKRVWKPGAIPALQEAFGKDAFSEPSVLSPAAIEKLSSRGKEMATEWAYKPDAGKLTIAPLSDRRPERKGSANAQVFEKHAMAQMEEF